MARYPFSFFERRGFFIRNRIYIILALLVVGLIIVVLYGRYPFGSDDTDSNIGASDNLIDKPGIQRSEAIKPVRKLAVEAEPKLILDDEREKTLAEPNPEVTVLIAEAMALVNSKPRKVMEARDKLNTILQMQLSEQQRVFVKEQLSELSNDWLFGPTVLSMDTLCDRYKVRPGDQLRIIGERFKVPYEILMQINNIRHPEALQAGKIIKVIKGPFHAKVYRSSFTMDLYLQDTFVRSFPVGLGKPGMETPIGLWVVKPGGKLIKPIWTNPLTGRTYRPEDLDYPLGSRWIALEGIEGAAKAREGFAIHGTKEPEQIGTAGSQGCIRLHNGDAILIYNLLVPTFSRVEVLD